MDKSSFLSQIGDHAGTLARVVQNGVLTYPTSYNETLDVHSKRTQASLMHDHIVQQARTLLPAPDFHWIFSGQRNLFSFRDKFLIHFKKLRRNLTTSNYPTSQAEFLDRLGGINCLPGIDAVLPLLSVGYIMKPCLAGIEGVFVTQIQNH